MKSKIIVLGLFVALVLGCGKKEKPEIVYQTTLEKVEAKELKLVETKELKLKEDIKENINRLKEGIKNYNAGRINYADESLIGIGKPAVPALIALLEDKDKKVQGNAAYVIAEIGPPAKEAVPALIKKFKLPKEDRPHLWNFARALAQIGPAAKDVVPELVPLLIEELENKDAHVRDYAALALGGIKDNTAVPVLIKLLKNTNHRLSVIRCLGEIGDPAAVEILIEELEYGPPVGSIAATALGKIRDKRVVPALIEVFGRKDVPSGHYGYHGVMMVPGFIRWNIDEAVIEALKEKEDPSATPVFLKALKDKRGDVRKPAAEALGTIKDPATIPDLIEALRLECNHDYSYYGPSAMEAIIRALGEIGSPAKEALPYLEVLAAESTDMNKTLSRAAREALVAYHIDISKVAREAIEKIQNSVSRD